MAKKTKVPSERLALAIEQAREAKGAQLQAALDRVAEAEAAVHRQEVIRRQLQIKSRGQALGFIITLLWLVGAVLIGIYSNPWAAAVFGSINLVPLVAIFVISKLPIEEKLDVPAIETA